MGAVSWSLESGFVMRTPGVVIAFPAPLGRAESGVDAVSFVIGGIDIHPVRFRLSYQLKHARRSLPPGVVGRRVFVIVSQTLEAGR